MTLRQARPWIVLGLIVGAAVLGWRALSFDRVDEVAHALVLGSDDNADLAVWAAAFSARYPQGARAEGLESFVVSHQGRCAEVAGSATLHCVLPLAGTICVGTGLVIEAHIDTARALSGLLVRRHEATC